MRVSEVAEKYEVSREGVYYWIRKGLIEFKKVPYGRLGNTRIEVDEDSVRKYLGYEVKP